MDEDEKWTGTLEDNINNYTKKERKIEKGRNNEMTVRESMGNDKRNNLWIRNPRWH